jgi:hypothetical protein
VGHSVPNLSSFLFGMSHSEKRRSNRKNSNYVVEFYDSDGLLLEGVGHLLDLSPTGALVSSSLRLQLGQTVLTRIRRAGQASLELLASVVRVRSKGAKLTYGLQFKRS